MKKTSVISLLIFCITFGTVATSCEDMLRPDSERHSYVVAQDTLYSYWGILKSLQNVAERYMVLGECRGELVSGTGFVSDSIQAILDFDMDKAVDGSCRYLRASDYYHIINSCNAYLASCDTVRVTGTQQPYMMKEAAQVEAIRAWTYLQLTQVYGKVPFYTKPLLTTDEITAFMKSPQWVEAKDLAGLLGPGLEKALKVERLFGLPQYENYRNVCHSTKVMIPLNLILADLNLVAEKYETAARYYYLYLSNDQGLGKMVEGGALPDGYDCHGYQGEGMDKPQYSGSSAPWLETGAVSATQESITAIPSSTNKLWGSVLRGVNELYGYDSEISVRTEETSDTTVSTGASIILYPQYDKKQLIASEAYFDLCKAQTYETFIGASSSDVSNFILTPDPAVGDARQYWVDDIYQVYPNGLRNTEKFVTKQNPYGVFSTVATMIYRKSMVWLRYAEALNRAGYPSYAFAILKNGLCNNEDWYPVANTSDYAVKDTTFFFVVEGDTLPADYRTNDICTNKESLYQYLRDRLESAEGIEEEDKAALLETIEARNYPWMARSYENYPDDKCSAALYYLDQREVLKKPDFLNYDFKELEGQISIEFVYYRTSLTQRGQNVTFVPVEGEKNATIGIHSRGCGYIPLLKNRESSYDYVAKVIEKAKAYGKTLTKEDIYSGEYDDLVQDCVEDLIVDESALELAFEGTRFFDLMRVADRRHDPSYLANKLAGRNTALQSKLQNRNNWFFPLPNN